MAPAHETEKPRFRVTDQDTAIYADIARRFDRYNREHTNWDWTAFSVVCGNSGNVAASARGVTNMGLVEIRGFWVDEDQRGKGIRSAMMTALEVEARRRGCTGPEEQHRLEAAQNDAPDLLD